MKKEPIDSESRSKSSETDRDSFPLVGIGASAGGLDAFKSFLNAVPVDTGMAFVLVQHLDPTHKSLMEDLLSRCTEMVVQQVEDGMLVEANHVYMIPPNRTMTIEDGVLRLCKPAERRGMRMAIDAFLCSLAVDQANRAVGIVLSGTGSDGAVGLKEIKSNGGLTLVQDPATAGHDGMPQAAIATGLVDLVCAVEKMPQILIRYASSSHANGKRFLSTDPAITEKPQDPDIVNQIFALIEEKRGIDFRGYKRATLARRIERRMGISHVEELGDYFVLLQTDSEELSRLGKDLLIGVTSFFRDPEVFESIETDVLRPLIGNARREDTVRIWVPACSTGEEAYSLAMLATEARAARSDPIEVQVFASDVDDDALEVARSGRYPAGSAAEVGADRMSRHFTTDDDGRIRVRKPLRELVVFAQQNLIGQAPFSRLDLISCRNLLIYFQQVMQDKVLAVFHFALKPGGYLLLGSSESINGLTDLFEPVGPSRLRLYRRLDTVDARRPELPFSFASGMLSDSSAVATVTPTHRQRLVEIASRWVIDEYAPATVVVNRQLDALFFCGPVERYLRFAYGEPNLSIVDIARDGLATRLRRVIKRAFSDGSGIQDDRARLRTQVESVPITLRVKPVQALGKGSEPLVLVSFIPLEKTQKASTESRDVIAQISGEESVDAALTQELENELRFTKQDLQSTIEEMETSNEELKASNEEVMSVNEELQSTNEELQTSKEELQSLNEELTTLNSQLREKVLELESANNDIANFVNSSDVALLFLDSQLTIRRYTPSVRQLFSLISGDIGRPLADLVSKIDDPNLIDDAYKVLHRLTAIEADVPGHDQRWFTRRILPYRTEDDRIDGVVIAFNDVTRLRQSDTLAKQQTAQLDNIYANAPIGMFLLDQELRWIKVNDRSAEMTGYGAAHHIGKRLRDLRPKTAGELEPRLQHVLDTGVAVRNVEVSGETPSQPGVLRHWVEHWVPFYDDRDEVAGISVVAEEVTDRKAAEFAVNEARRESDRARVAADLANRAKTEFLANMSHEIRTPLTAILGYADILAAQLDDPDNVRATETIRLNGKHLLTLLNDFLDQARIEEGQLTIAKTPVSPAKVLSEVVEQMAVRAHEEQLKLKTIYVTQIPETVPTDEVRLRQILINLISNAIKFGRGGITDRAEVLLEVSLTDGIEQHLRIDVKDFGIGMGSDEQSEIFSRFTQAEGSNARRYPGTGLGLTISIRLAELLGGRIDVNSVSGQGSTFSLLIPVGSLAGIELIEPGTEMSSHVERLIIPKIDARILVVDDRADVRAVIQHQIELTGATVELASDGEKAIKAVSLFMATGKNPIDMILMDIQMPVIDGYETTRQIRARGFSNPVVALTASAISGERERCLSAGCNDFLAKPVEQHALLRLVAQYCENGQRGGSLIESAPTPDLTEVVSNSSAKFLVVEDNLDARSVLVELLQLDGHQAVGAANGAEAIKAARTFMPGFVFLDLGLPDIDGYEVAKQLRQIEGLGSARIVALTGRRLEKAELLKVGFDDYLLKPINSNEFLKISKQAFGDDRSE